MRRLAEFRAVNTEDETVLNYFDELEIHPDHVGEFWKFFPGGRVLPYISFLGMCRPKGYAF